MERNCWAASGRSWSSPEHPNAETSRVASPAVDVAARIGDGLLVIDDLQRPLPRSRRTGREDALSERGSEWSGKPLRVLNRKVVRV